MSSNQVRATLQEFCDKFLDYGYNSSMNGTRNLILRSENSLEDNDEIFYFHNMKTFMSYAMARPVWLVLISKLFFYKFILGHCLKKLLLFLRLYQYLRFLLSNVLFTNFAKILFVTNKNKGRVRSN